ncbi:amidohydrolase family protein [Bacillus sonorensis]|uniref:amidohydrolase family protein n=1 Tax=Bacillus TaxID=1386 RepID=UPI001B263444|nr:amidohydrolase family protein [Bacillus sonorensis]MCY7858635.1 amidohydrolase family protein [Bacillus sonorensis]MCY8272148.1 amidohydrolase family protein [Bacillus sonorensis]MCY8606533.1 amidohydrolase family protein [Bacillus sonorensis]MEC1356412.1 amidohydrolase family protein [Bacillus sonorensis]MEC1427904.1 amidohydrolase family protein [Bacillus sonorensis]
MRKTLFQNATIITLDPRLKNIEKGDMLIEGSTIVEVAGSIVALDAEVIDASNMVIMPGLVDTHRHVWESVIRGIGADWSLQTYLSRIYYGNYGSMRRPEDDWIANYLGALEALDAGVTTLLDWTMIESPDHTDQLIAGLKKAGIRAVFAFGTSGDAAYWDRESNLSNMDEAKRVKKAYFQSKDQLLTMGLAIRGPEFSSWDTSAFEIKTARELDVLCSMHIGFGNWGAKDRSIEKLHKAGLLGPDLNMVHVNAISEEEMKMLSAHGSSISVTPEIEMMMGHGYPVTGLALKHGVHPSLGVDVVTSTGGDLFVQMKFALQAERAKQNEALLKEGIMPGPELGIFAEQILEAATIDGARALMLDHKIGSLSPGKEADFIMLKADSLNLLPLTDVTGAIVQTAHPGNIDSVYVAGKAVKQQGKLVDVDLEDVRKRAVAARDHILSRAPEAAF